MNWLANMLLDLKNKDLYTPIINLMENVVNIQQNERKCFRLILHHPIISQSKPEKYVE